MTHAFGWDAITCCDYFEVIYHFQRNIYYKMAQEEVTLNVYDMVSMINDFFITLNQNNTAPVRCSQHDGELKRWDEDYYAKR